MQLTEGIILSRSTIGEADELFTIYTKDFGKIKARAQGIKKEEARLKGHIEPLSLSTIGLVSTRQGERLVFASLQEFWPRVRADYHLLSAAHGIIALVDVHCMENEPDPGLWGLLENSMRLLGGGSMGAENCAQFMRVFEKDFRAVLGYGGEDGEKDPFYGA